METKLYDGEITVRFNEGSHRYTISSDGGKTWDYANGVTGILGRTLAKEALMMWPMDEALRYLFGQTFEDVIDNDGNITSTPKYNASNAALVPDVAIPASLLQRMLEQARTVHTEKKDKGADTGKLTHKAIEAFLRSKLDGSTVTNWTSDPQAQKAYGAFVKWYEAQENITPVQIEQVVYSLIHKYAGTFDCLLDIDGELILGDVKTSNYSRTAPLGVYADNFFQLGAYAWAYREENIAGPPIKDLMVINCSKQGKVNVVRASELGLSVEDCEQAWLNTFRIFQVRDKLIKDLSKRRK